MKKLLLLLIASSFTGAIFGQNDSTFIEEPEYEDEIIYEMVETVPEFPGGMEGLYAFLTENLEYPKMAKHSDIQGKIYIGFVVERDGSISNVEVIKGRHESLDNEAIRVIKMMPKWKPGEQQGRLVRAKFVIPIVFHLEDNKRKTKKKKQKQVETQGN